MFFCKGTHSTDKAIIAGLAGEGVKTTNPNFLPLLIEEVLGKTIPKLDRLSIHFDFEQDFFFHSESLVL
ncbi:serine dehydratase beta chain [Suttonella ornithocola]|uniref:Serine dehydratase beta chain domain-containing protein n=1 Tax=Suttonella ornithocola TaxID=279832 RepID=A0A380MRE8_9GAMM|nr:serine dehydratase beta chain [Suttonella ornithocola]SUO94882.1 Uncharacterised protein [Suttonella ornithocola]